MAEETFSMDKELIRKLNAILDAHLEDETFGVNELADEIGLSRSQLHRKLNALTGKSSSQFIREYRLEKALEMLENNEATASEIAYRVGFNSPTYFNTSFKERYGYTPGEVKIRHTLREETKHAKSSIAKRTGLNHPLKKVNYKTPVMWVGILSIIGLLAFTVFYGGDSKKMKDTTIPNKINNLNKTIAVLPFKSLSDDKENGYFAQGMREDIISHLSRIQGLIVKSRQSTEKYDNSNFTVKQISEALGVNYVIDGSVQIYNGRVKIRVSLINADADVQLWAKDFDREFKDVFTLESEISRQIASELDLILSPNELQRIGKVPTENIEAYELLNKGRYFLFDDNGEESYDLARKYFRQSIKIDPNFALAYSFMAESYLYEHWPNPNIEDMINAKGYALKAIELDDELSDSHRVLGWIYASYEWNWEKAEEEFERSIRLNPNNTYALCTYSLYLQYTKGDFEKARNMVNRALLIAPFSFYANILSACYYSQQGDYNNALEASKKAEESCPDDLWPYWVNFEIYAKEGKAEMAVKELEESWSMKPETKVNVAPMLEAYTKNGIKGIYQWINDLDINHSTEERVILFNAFWIAQKFAFLGEKELAMDWLEIGYKGKNADMFKAKYDPYFIKLHNEPRFLDIMDKMDLGGYNENKLKL